MDVQEHQPWKLINNWDEKPEQDCKQDEQHKTIND